MIAATLCVKRLWELPALGAHCPWGWPPKRSRQGHRAATTTRSRPQVGRHPIRISRSYPVCRHSRALAWVAALPQLPPRRSSTPHGADGANTSWRRTDRWRATRRVSDSRERVRAPVTPIRRILAAAIATAAIAAHGHRVDGWGAVGPERYRCSLRLRSSLLGGYCRRSFGAMNAPFL
jgi:hypothetical protein